MAAEPFLNGTSSNYVEEMYYAWLENPKNVHKVIYIFLCFTSALFLLEVLTLFFSGIAFGALSLMSSPKSSARNASPLYSQFPLKR